MSEEQQEQVQQTPEQVAVEKEARLMGWVPKDEFRDGDHWSDAETFVKRGKEINPILRKNNETLLKKLEEAHREVAEVKQVAKEFEKFQKEVADRKVKEMSEQLAALKEQKKTAVSQSDGDAVVAIDDAIEAIKEEQQAAKTKEVEAKKAPVVEVPITKDPIVTQWMADNPWFTTDEKMTRTTDIIGTRINQESPHLKGKAFFDELDKQVQEMFPDKFKTTSRSSPVEGNTEGTRRSGSSKKQSYENLPAEAKSACDRFIKNGMIKNREAYLAEYDWSE